MKPRIEASVESGGDPPSDSIKDHRHDVGREDLRRPYKSPNLAELGDIRDVTLGGSPGVGDSGPDPFNFKLPGT